MPEKMVHYIAGPLDGQVELMQEDRHPFAVSWSADTDGCYAMEYQVAGQRIGASAQDFMTGDAVIVKDSGARGTAVGPMTVVNDDGTTEERWMVSVDSNLISVTPDKIRIATSEELSDGEAV